MNQNLVIFTCGEEPASLGYIVEDGNLWASPYRTSLRQLIDGSWRLLEGAVVHHTPTKDIDPNADSDLRLQAMGHAMGLRPLSAEGAVKMADVVYAFLKGDE